jgi:hypothetical protein
MLLPNDYWIWPNPIDTREPAFPVLADFPAEPQDARC